MRLKIPHQISRAKLRWVALGSVATYYLAIVLISCTTLTPTVIAPPGIPGAEFAGSDSCEVCHEEITRDFKTAAHARLRAKGENNQDIGCESCHGPGSLHVESGGAVDTIVNPKKSPDICFQCHLDVQSRFQLPHRHPVLENFMSCNDCHNPHKGPAIRGGSTQIASSNETCFRCHSVQASPFVFEHEAMRDGCLACHQPHGSVNARMLTERNAVLCLKCHFQEQTTAGVVLIGGRDHTAFLSRGTCWSAGCHEAIHGSNVNSSLRF
jgi:predicted CXXCH cytochrome family protein